MLKQGFLLLCCLLTVQFCIAQMLPRGLTSEEEQIIRQGIFEKATALPGAYTHGLGEGSRSMAEWEEMQAIVITWAGFSSILAEIVRAVQGECEVIIVCSDENNVKNYLVSKDIDPDQRISYIEAPYNTIWVRDYGPNPVYKNGIDSLVLVDWIYNRPRPKDDQIPVVVGNYLDVPVFSTVTPPNDLVHTGGNFMSDGLGTGFSSELVLEENDETNNFGTSNHSPEDIDNIMLQFMGIDQYAKMTVLPYDGIHHIDMHMKIVDEETIIVGEYPEGIADGPQIEANLQFVLNNFTTKSGKPFNIVRIPMPPDEFGRYPHQGGHYRTYTNALFVNKTVIVPVYDEEYDSTALRIWQEILPGYNIVGIDCNAIIPLGGAIHCVTKEVGTTDPLLIQHARVRGADEGQSVDIAADIRHISGIKAARVFYRYSGSQEYDSLEMTIDNGNRWTSTIDNVFGGTEVQYYIKAEAVNGKVQYRPMPAPEAYFEFPVSLTSAFDAPSGLPDVGFDVFPNPASAITCIPVRLPSGMQADIVLLDVMGREISVIHSGEVAKGESKFFLQAADFTPGTYLLQLRTGREVISKKFVIY